MFVEDSFQKLTKYIEKEKYQGYDPYDILTSWIPFNKLGKWPSAIATQIQKRSPVNFRPLIGIKKGINPKAYGLFLQAFSLLYQKTNKSEYLKKADFFYNWLNNNYSQGYSGKCWGYNFPWASPLKYMDAYAPSSVVTGFVVKGLSEYRKVTENKKDVETLIDSACQFLNKDLEKVKVQTGINISYTPLQKDICYNASLLAGEAFAKLYAINSNELYKNLAIQTVEYVLTTQKEDGHWNYSMDIDKGGERSQIDFHQGYILESIYEIKSILKIQNSYWEKAIEKGLEFYIEQQFDKNGWSYWRLPKKHPIEIHNQSQGIITLQKLKNYHPDASNFSKTIAEWTIKNMQAKDGHFYYQKFKTHTNRISYMRWSNTWMLLALTHLLES